MHIFGQLEKKGLIKPPKWLSNNILYLTIAGSEAYGVSTGSSDKDIFGFAIPPKDYIFPHLRGDIFGFGNKGQGFDQFERHHIKDNGVEWDFCVTSIIKFFELLRQGNPDKIDLIFTPRRCVIHSTNISELIREKRKIFLHKGCWFRYKGYAYQMMSKMKNKNPVGKRKELVDKFGYDTKFAYHLVRLLLEVEQILLEEDLDIERNREQLKAIRRGEWEEARVYSWFSEKEQQLEKAYAESHLRNKPDEVAIKELLMHCLEDHYGSLDKMGFHVPGRAEMALQEIQTILENHS